MTKERIEKIIDYWFALARTSKKSEWDELYSRNECIRNLIEVGLVFKDEVGIDEEKLTEKIVFHLESGGWCLMSTYLNSGDVKDLVRGISTHTKDLLTFVDKL